MPMTLDEAIKHCLETAEESEEMTAKAREDFANVEIPENINYYGLLYSNIAEWLTELKELKAENEKLKAAIALIKELWKRLQKDMAIVTGKTEELIGEQENQQ